MLVRIRGTLESLDGTPPRAIIAPEGQPGLAYEVLLPAYLAERLKDEGGTTITLRTIEYLESPNQGASFVPRLIGFTSDRERAFFELFTTVKGLGTRRALRALALEPGEIAAAIIARDTRRLTQLPEIGKRLAETIIAELSGKVDAFADLAPEAADGRAPAKVTPAAEDAVTALVALGETRTEAERIVTRAMQKNPALRATDEILQAALAAR
jgi:Holliday junction DNA helicase RuvA